MNSERKKVIVIGAAGVLGRLITQELVLDDRYQVYVGDYREERAPRLVEELGAYESVLIDANNLDHLNQLIKKFDCVVVALKQEKPLIQKVCFDYGISCVDVNAFKPFTSAVKALPNQENAVSVVFAGLFPGLSGVFVNDLNKEFDQIDEANVFLVQSTNAKIGKMGIVDMMEVISAPLSSGNLPFGRRYKLKVNDKVFYQHEIDHGERQLLEEQLGLSDLHYWTGWDKRPYTQLIRFLVRTSLINPLLTLVTQVGSGHKKDDPETVYLVIEANGKVNNKSKQIKYTLEASSDYGMTAIIVRTLVNEIMIGRTDLKGTQFPFEIINHRAVVLLSPKSTLTTYSITTESTDEY